ncbi:hypothetical protein KIN20_008060 [Parelaphostrongylus tenuis]|uniref:Uncharacterized protein n=1 Tax=Parelaphostrongylus tenuis TaxID=148309 RepID=A0AAD5MM99_PARTN|nr:hypothetical protein KIN20_008060 [Parelaphostrongylus tenuis]
MGDLVATSYTSEGIPKVYASFTTTSGRPYTLSTFRYWVITDDICVRESTAAMMQRITRSDNFTGLAVQNIRRRLHSVQETERPERSG